MKRFRTKLSVWQLNESPHFFSNYTNYSSKHVGGRFYFFVKIIYQDLVIDNDIYFFKHSILKLYKMSVLIGRFKNSMICTGFLLFVKVFVYQQTC